MTRYEDIDSGFRRILQLIQSLIREGKPAWHNGYLGLFGEMRTFYRKFWDCPIDWAYAELLGLLDEPADLLVAAAMDAESRDLIRAARQLAEAAARINPHPRYKVIAAGYARLDRSMEQARRACQELAAVYPDSQDVQSELFLCDVADRFWPQDYYALLEEIHATCHPAVYLEIGVATGKSLAIARSCTRALGVDPATASPESLFYHSPENIPQLYKMTSDVFFETTDVFHEMGRQHFDVAFIDGLHHFDQVLLDFINLEKLAGPDSVILIHDCLPINAQVAARERSTAFWTGDVWKVIPCLRAVRTDLEIITLPVAPSGIALIRGLDPGSRILERQFDILVQHFAQSEFPENWDECCRALNVCIRQADFNLKDYLPDWGKA